MASRVLKHAILGTALSGFLAGLMGCTSLVPRVEPTPLVETPQPKILRRVPPPKVVKPVRKQKTAKKVIIPVEDEPVPAPVIPSGGGG
ncbi:MAG: hypothetical protein E5W81_20155, partial [Mesorhizobium sp.]